MTKTSAKTVWVRVLNEAPLFIRRRASAYLKNIRKTSENEWMIGVIREPDTGFAYKGDKLRALVRILSRRGATANTSAPSRRSS